MPGHGPVNPLLNCTYADFLAIAQATVLHVYSTSNNPNWLSQYNLFVLNMWDRYNNPSAQWGGCNWFPNRLYAQFQNPNSSFPGWTYQLTTLTPNSYAWRLKLSKIRMACHLWRMCCGEFC